MLLKINILKIFRLFNLLFHSSQFSVSRGTKELLSPGGIAYNILTSLTVYYVAAFSKSLMLRYRQGLKIAVEWIMEVRNRVVPQFIPFLSLIYSKKKEDLLV